MTQKKKKTTPTQSEKDDIKLKDIFNTFAFWYSIPTVLKTMSEKELLKAGYDVKDVVFRKLLKIRWKQDFAKVFNVSKDTLTDWLVREDFQKLTKKYNLENNVLRFEKDVDLAFTRRTIRNADAHRVKLWKQVFTGWQEKATVENVGEVKFTFVRKKA